MLVDFESPEQFNLCPSCREKVKPWRGYGLEILVIYRFYGQEKLGNWLMKKVEAVKKELECKVSKCLKKILRKPFKLVIFSILVSKIFGLSVNWREKKAKFTISCRK